MTRQEAESQIVEHFKEIIKIAKKYDKDVDYLNLSAFVSDGYMSVTNGKTPDDPKRLSCHYLSHKSKKLISD